MTPEKRRGQMTLESGTRKHLVDLALILLMTIISLALSRLLGVAQTADGPPDNGMAEYRREFRSYIYGIILAFGLTCIPFALVYWSVISGLWLSIAIGAFALIQIVVHLRFFLHIDPPRQKVDDLHLILFTTLVLAIMAGGTIWILANLATRMH